MKSSTRPPYLSILAWIIVLLSVSTSNSPLWVRAQEEEAAAHCDCSADVENAKQDTSKSFQSTIDDLAHKLNEAMASLTGKDGEIASLTASMAQKVEELTSQLSQKVQETEAAQKVAQASEETVEQMKASLKKAQEEVEHASQASKETVEQMKASLKQAQEKAASAHQQVSKYVNQRFYINVQLLKQDFNNMLKKLGLNGGVDDTKSDDL